MNIVLVEADYLDGQGVINSLYLANAPFYSAASDMPANQPYDDCIIGGLRISAKMDEVLQGATSIKTSNIELLNMPWINLSGNYSGQQLRVFMGKRGQNKAQFTQIYTATIEDLVIKDAEKLALKIRNTKQALTEPLQQVEVGDKGNKKPLSFGQCLNVSPVVVNKNTWVFSVNDGAVTSIATVRKSGVAIAKTDNLTAGEFSFSAEQGGTITADIVAPNATAKDIILAILARIDVPDIDNASLNLLPTTAMSLYIAKGESASAALDALVNSVGFFWHFKRNGQFMVGEFKEGQAPSAIIYPDEIQHNGMKVLKTIKPAKEIKLTYNTNWTQQRGNLDAAVSLANSERYASNGDLVTSINVGIATQYPDAQVRKRHTLLIDTTAAQAEADRRALLLNATKRIYQIRTFTAPFNFELGQTITVVYPFLDFANGKSVIITAIIDDPLAGTSTLEVFC